MTPRQIVSRFFQEGYTNRNFDFVMECVAENYIDHSPAGARSNADAVGILKIVAEQYTYLRTEMVDIFGEGGMVATRVRYDGLHRETGRRITFEALENFRVENGRIVESWGYWPDREIEEKLRGESAPRSVDMPPARQTEKE